ncbi:MAG: MBL fold metallo-hydrolase [Thermoplasmatales archaeon]|nr:MBL fold metallo-hydrolase [Thermoplasmatales archaeon]
MIATFLGGGREVGRVGIFLEIENKKILIDYGISPQNPPVYPIESPPVKDVILSHAHLDHSGMIPWICRRYNTRVFSTKLTREISQILFYDTLKIADASGYPFPYDMNDIEIANQNFFDVEKKIFIDDDIEINLYPAGHIPGSTMIKINDSLFACDINTIETRLLHGVKPVKCRNLFIEGTYAGVDHPDRIELEKKFIDDVEDVVNNGGKAIIPAFALGRTQEIAMILAEREKEVWVDGMGYQISEIFLENGKYIKSPQKLKKAIEKINFVYSNQGKKLALKAGIVITTSGMMNGGPVLWYIDKIKDDPKSAVFISGYQVEGTNGRRLLDNKEIDLYGVVRKVNCQVKFYDFSAHAGHSQLVKFINECSPENIIIFHSEKPELLAEEIEANTYIPKNGEKIEIGGD